MAQAVLAVLQQVKAVLADVTVQGLPADCMAAAVLVLYLIPVLITVARAHEVRFVLFGPVTLAHTPQLAQAHHEFLY